MTKNKLVRMSEDEFYEKYNPVKNHLDTNAAFDGCMFETYGEEVEYVNRFAESENKNKVWTIIDANGNLCYLSGWHFVNRFGYLITEEAVPEDTDIEVELDNVIDESRISTAKFVKEITVVDPDTKGEVEIEIYKHENGGMFGVDSSFLEQGFDDDECPLIQDPLEIGGKVKLMDTNSLSNFIESVDLPQD